MGLEIVLEDSPLHRLLLHAIVQYHGLQTRVSIQKMMHYLLSIVYALITIQSYDSKGHRCDNGVPQLQSQKKRDGRNANKASPVTQSNDTLRKAILVYRGQRSLQNEVPSTQQDRLSLVSFLQYKQKQRDDSKMQHLMRQIGLTASSC